MGNGRLRTGESQRVVGVQRSRGGGIFVANCAVIFWQVCELPTPMELGTITLLAVRAQT